MTSVFKNNIQKTELATNQITRPLLADFSQTDSITTPNVHEFIPFYVSNIGTNSSIEKIEKQTSFLEATILENEVTLLKDIIQDLKDKLFHCNSELEHLNYDQSHKIIENIELQEIINKNNIANSSQNIFLTITSNICEKISSLLNQPIFNSLLKHSLFLLQQEIDLIISDLTNPAVTIYGSKQNIDLFDKYQNSKIALKRVYIDKIDLTVEINDVIFSTRLSQLSDIFFEKCKHE